MSSSLDFSRPSPVDGYYDVFLSFRGIDTRKGFTTTLYHALQQNEIYTFMDEDLMGERIDHLFEVIAKSRMAVVIYSENFASSDWCLKELETIMQRQEDKKILVTPIFYKVDLKELKHLTGKTAQYLDEHIAKYDKSNVDVWKVAIKKLGGVSGISYKEIEFRSEYEFIRHAIARIKKKLLTVPTQEQRSDEGSSSRKDTIEKATRENGRTIFYEAKVLDPNRITSRGFSYIGEVKPLTGDTTPINIRENAWPSGDSSSKGINDPKQGAAICKYAWVMKIYVIAIFRADPIPLQVNPGTTIGTIKAQVKKILRLKITADKQHLYYNGEELEDNSRNLASYKIPNEAALCTFKDQ